MIVLKLLKKGILFIIKEIVSFLIKVLLVVGIVVFILFRVNVDIQKNKEVLKNNTYIELDFSQGVEEKGGVAYFHTEDEQLNFYTTIRMLEEIKSDRRIAGVIVKTDSVGLNRAQLEEISEKLEEVKESGKKVYSFSRNFDNRGYLLALSAGEIIMPPSRGTNVDIKGYYMETRYLKRLTDKIGVKYNVIHVGDYKAFGETYTRETMSPQRREDLSRLFDSIYEGFIDKVAEKRGLDRAELNERVLNGDFVLTDSLMLKEEGMIDGLEYYSQFLNSRNIQDIISPGSYLKYADLVKDKKDKIALVYGEGSILYSADRSAKTTITPSMMIDELERAEEDEDVKGIVVRIDSPGGSALASEVINAKMKEIEKPIYISMGGTSASGGYYISAAGNKIFASHDTVTGSIGVVSIIPNFSEVTDKIGVNTEVIERGRLAGVYSLFNEMTEEEREKIYSSSLGVYSEFKQRVTEGRRIPDEELEKIAGGRVWLGYEAKENGLVDEIGGLEDTIRALASDLELSEYEVVEVRGEKPFSKLLMNYARLMGAYGRVEAILELDDKRVVEEVEEDELLIRPTVYFPYNLEY